MESSPARKILQKLRDHGYQAYFAGGCVRDMLLGLEPHDIDIATEALPEQIEKIFSRTISVGAQFGVIIVLQEDAEIQVATFRHDGTYSDGRHPNNVIFTNAEEDSKRRDFTINGLFYDPITKEVLDYVQGSHDLSLKIIRAIGDPEQRFKEDKLRLLRAIRFATTLTFEIDPATWEALCKLAPEIHVVSEERIRDEIEKIFLSPHRNRGFDLLDQSGLLKEIFPEIEDLKGCEQPPEFHPEGDVFVHTRMMLSLLPLKASLPLILSVLFHDIGKPSTRTVDMHGTMRFYAHDQVGAKMTEKILQRLRFSNKIIDAVVPAVRLHMSFKDVPKMRLSTLRRMMARPTFKDELELHRVDCTSSHGMLDNYELLLQKQSEFASIPLLPQPLVTGRDLMVLGLQPGPEFGKILQIVKEAQLENLIHTKEEAMALAKQSFSSHDSHFIRTDHLPTIFNDESYSQNHKKTS
ncbi:MAG: CCA tRNA nucleotidyltransferase [Chthoniobacterales bacterium]|nr:CCA tRNA nucleotidyltransferase [Chthoniobacterales bacterium]